MIPLSEVQIINGPDDALSFAPTSQITELEFRRGSLHIRHSKETVWPSVMIETAQQQATFWVLALINGAWYAAGMERLRPNQQDKPEGDDPTGFLAGFVEGRNFGPFNGHTFQRGDRMGFMVVQGNTRLAQDAPLRERSLVVETDYPPTRILWCEGADFPAEPAQTPETPAPSPDVPYGDIQDVLKAIGEVKETLRTLATKQDIAEAREEFVNAAKGLGAVLPWLRR